jgi:hypothetical protein
MASHSTNHPFRAPGVSQELRTRKPNPLGAHYVPPNGQRKLGAHTHHGYDRAGCGSYQTQTTRNPAAALPYGSLAEIKS